jgi:hypothetical protein
MGSFDYTCSISGLPIQCGTPVRLIPLASLDKQSHACYVASRYCLLSLPIKAIYNDYGSIEKFNKNDVNIKMFLQILKERVIEKPIGDNTCHDVAIDKDMSFERWLTALIENRIEVDNWRLIPEYKEPENYIPMFKQLENKLGKGYIVSEILPNVYRVRNTTWDNKDLILKAQEIFEKEYATVITTTTYKSSSAINKELILFPHPDSKNRWDNEFFTHSGYKIQQAIVREDVWDWIVNYKSNSRSLKTYLTHCKKYWKLCKDNYNELLDFGKLENDNVFVEGLLLCRENSFFLKDIWKIALNSNLSSKEESVFLKSMAETIKAHDVLDQLRFCWNPGHTVGQQCDDFRNHVEYFSFLTTLAKKENRKYLKLIV